MRVVGERLVGGKIYFLLDCGHLVPARFTAEGDWDLGIVRRCRLCPLPPVVRVRLDKSGWDTGNWAEEVGC